MIYYADCPNEKCRGNYIDEGSRRISEGMKDHNGRDLKAYILRHSVEFEHANLVMEILKLELQ